MASAAEAVSRWATPKEVQSMYEGLLRKSIDTAYHWDGQVVGGQEAERRSLLSTRPSVRHLSLATSTAAHDMQAVLIMAYSRHTSTKERFNVLCAFRDALPTAYYVGHDYVRSSSRKGVVGVDAAQLEIWGWPLKRRATCPDPIRKRKENRQMFQPWSDGPAQRRGPHLTVTRIDRPLFSNFRPRWTDEPGD